MFVGVAVGVWPEVTVGVGVAVFVGVFVGVAVIEAVLLGVLLGVWVGVAVIEAVLLGVWVGVVVVLGVGVGVKKTFLYLAILLFKITEGLVQTKQVNVVIADPSFTLTHKGIGKFRAPAGITKDFDAVGFGLNS